MSKRDLVKFLGLAYQALEKGDYPKAIKYSTLCIEGAPKDEQAYSYRAISYEALGDKHKGHERLHYWKKALGDHKESVRLLPLGGLRDIALKRRDSLQKKIEALEAELGGGGTPTPIPKTPTPTPTPIDRPPIDGPPPPPCPPAMAPLSVQNLAPRALGGKQGDGALALAFSPDGKWLATGSFVNRAFQSGTLANSAAKQVEVSDIRIWDVATGQRRLEIEGHWEGNWPKQTWIGHWGKVNTLAFAPHRALLASGGQDGEIILWDWRSGQQLRRLSEFKGHPLVAVAFSCDGSRFWAGTLDGAVRLWDTRTWNSSDELRTGHAAHVAAYAFSPDGRFIASGAEGGVKTWRWSPRTMITVQRTPDYTPRALAFLRDDSLVIGAEGSINFFIPSPEDTGAWQFNGSSLHYETRRAKILAAAPDARTIAIGRGNRIELWDRIEGPKGISQTLLRPDSKSSNVVALAFSPQGWPLAATYEDGTLLLWQ